jgi:hypothetical protein
VLERVEEHQPGAGRVDGGEPVALGERDRGVTEAVGDEQAAADAVEHGKRGEVVEGLSRARGQGGQKPRDRGLAAIGDEGEQRLAGRAEAALDRAGVVERVGELPPGDRGDPFPVGRVVDEAGQQREELPAVVLLLLPVMSDPPEPVSARRDEDDDVAEIGVAAEAPRQAETRKVGGGQEGRPRAEAEARDADRPRRARRGQVLERRPGLRHLATAEAEGRQALELGNDDQLPVAREKAREPDQLGMAPAGPREPVDEE